MPQKCIHNFVSLVEFFLRKNAYSNSPQLGPTPSPTNSKSSPTPSPSLKAIIKISSNTIDSTQAQDPNSELPSVRTNTGGACGCNINPQVNCNPEKLMIINVVAQCQPAEICSGECEYQVYCGEKIGDKYYIDYEIVGADAPNKRYPKDGSPSTGWAADCVSNV